MRQSAGGGSPCPGHDRVPAETNGCQAVGLTGSYRRHRGSTPLAIDDQRKNAGWASCA